MNAPLLLMRLGAAALVFTLLAGLLMLARRRLRAWIGAEAAYALWLALPLGVALCGWPLHRLVVRVRLPAAAAFDTTAPASALAGSAAGGPGLAAAVLGAWLLGACAAALVLALRQRRLQRALGPLQRLDGDAWLAGRSDHGPMLVGLPRPRIVLPADFMTRYTPDEQAAILAHERLHRRRGDLWWNALAAMLRCLFWFHPLAPGAQRRFLADQELACDSAVLRSRRHSPRAYANALLKTQIGAAPPLACTMQAGSPLKERILNLQRAQAHPAPRRARLAAALALALLGAAGARIAWAASLQVVTVEAPAAASASAPAALKATLDLSIDGAAPRHDERIIAGTLHLDGLRDERGRDCAADLAPRLLPNDTVDLRMQLVCDGQPAGNPRLLARLGEASTIAIGITERQPDGSYRTTRGFRLGIRFDRP